MFVAIQECCSPGFLNNAAYGNGQGLKQRLITAENAENNETMFRTLHEDGAEGKRSGEVIDVALINSLQQDFHLHQAGGPERY